MNKTMKTLIKMQFDPEIAKAIGVEEAIMYSNIEYWCGFNKSNNKHFHDGYYWTYNSKRAFSELFNFWTEKQIKRILNNLIKNDYIKIGNYNKSKYDKTNWYAIFINYDEKKDCPKQDYSIGLNSPTDCPKKTNRSDQGVRPIPYNNTDIKKTNNKRFSPAKAGTNKKEDLLSLLEKPSIEKPSNNIPPKNISEIIDIFRKTNKSIKFENKTERKAAEDIIKDIGFLEAVKWAEFAVFVQGVEFAPQITTPFFLWKKLTQLKSHYKTNEKKYEKSKSKKSCKYAKFSKKSVH